jgi:hypothetical protein
VGAYTVQFRRGTYFEKKSPAPSPDSLTGSPLYGPLSAIGFDDASIARIIRKYKPQLIQVWADITLAAKEKSPGFFKVSPQAYFMDNIDRASRGTRTPPDWWYEHRKEEERRERESKRQLLNLPEAPKHQRDEERAFEEYLKGEGQGAFADILGRLVGQYRGAGQSPREAERNAAEAARTHLRNRFRQEHPEFDSSAPASLGDILKNFRLP